ncbi:serine protease easter-like [Copidosoma floridanum]|uniref:serine protease easter-like n=1 Tax=Copidosoma floridanum TaxID=29053 RepID=UPI0006C946E1|nr:serine protease easter-like [Copidosoma floridanum]
MNKVSLVFVCSLFSLSIVTIVNSYESRCEDDMVCKRITECGNHIKHIKRLHLTSGIQHRNLLLGPIQRLTCGFEGKIPKICCPSNDEHDVFEESRAKTNLKNRSVQGGCGNFLWNRNLPRDGGATDIFEFPWLALLQYKSPSGMKIGCGGVLISDRHVLTAAHCIHPPQNMKLTSVRLGEYDLGTDRDCIDDDPKESPNRFCNDKPLELGIDAAIIHEGYDPLRGPSDFNPLSYDIALLRLDRPVEFSDFVRPVCLPDRKFADEGKYLASGWGALPSLDRPMFNLKRVFRVNFTNRSACNAIYRRSLQRDVVCAAAKKNNLNCIGDSGGPLMAVDSQSRMTVVGVYAPAGDGSCRTKYIPNTYTDVRQYMDWILSKM